MTYKMMPKGDGTLMRVVRDDAVKLRNPDRYYVPTKFDVTMWVSTWEEFTAAGGNCGWNEDQTEIELLLPEPYKFSIQFMRDRKKEAA